jgi:hypothetical protein
MMENKLEEIRKRVTEGIGINRLPGNTKERFIELADKEFCSDRGFALKWLMDFREGLLSNPNEELLTKIEILSEELVLLKKEIASLKNDGKKDVRKTLSGRIVGGKKDGE